MLIWGYNLPCLMQDEDSISSRTSAVRLRFICSMQTRTLTSPVASYGRGSLPERRDWDVVVPFQWDDIGVRWGATHEDGITVRGPLLAFSW